MPNTRAARIPHSLDLTGMEGTVVTHLDGTTTTMTGNGRAYPAVGYSLTDQPQTVAALAEVAEVSVSETREALVRLEAGGLAERTDDGWLVAVQPDEKPVR